MKVIAVRHGETAWNVEGREQGQLDSPLTERGARQARALAERLRSEPFTALYSSDLGRAVQTAEIVAAVTGKSIVFDAGLRERHSGIFQGMTATEMGRRFPSEYADFQRLGHTYQIPQGESWQQRVDRSVRTFTALAARHPHETIVAVTHGGLLSNFFEQVLGMEPGNSWRFKRHNASYSSFEFDGERFTLDTWNDASHLQNLGSLDDPTAQLTAD